MFSALWAHVLCDLGGFSLRPLRFKLLTADSAKKSARTKNRANRPQVMS
jgi:hypothetical protein